MTNPMNKVSTIAHLYAGKPKPFGPRQSPSSIVKARHKELNLTSDGAIEDEQGNKKLHGGPFMAVHQYAQESYDLLKAQFPAIAQSIELGTIGENISAPSMNEHNVFIGDQYKMGSAILKVVSPRAPCAKINHRYGVAKIDLCVAQHGITGWYYSVVQNGVITENDDIVLIHRDENPMSVKEIWDIRQLQHPVQNPEANLALANKAFQDPSLSPEWQSYMNRAAVKLAKAM